MEIAVDGVDAEGHALDREAHLGGGALDRAGGARGDDGSAGEVGEPRVGGRGGALLDGVGEGVDGQEDVGSASGAAAA